MFTLEKNSSVNKIENSIIMMAIPTIILKDTHLTLLDKFIFTIVLSSYTKDPLQINTKTLANISGQANITPKDVVNSLRNLSDKGWIKLSSFGKSKCVVNINFTKIIIKQHKLGF